MTYKLKRLIFKHFFVCDLLTTVSILYYYISAELSSNSKAKSVRIARNICKNYFFSITCSEYFGGFK